MKTEQKCYIIGHKNPDTDSICSAIAYSYLKNAVDGSTYKYEACRAGKANNETSFVLDYFKVDAPLYLDDAGTQVKEINVHEIASIVPNLSIKQAWETMGTLTTSTLAVTSDDDKLEGLITVKDIASSYMESLGRDTLAKSAPSYKNIAETLNGKLIIGDENKTFDSGNVMIGAFRPDMIESVITPNDLVIIGDRTEDQISVLDMGARCLVVGLGAEISADVQAKAKELGCIVISSPFDSYTIARLINQSIPVKHLMKSDELVYFYMDTKIDDVKEITTKTRHRDYPVLDAKNKYVGMISRRDLIGCPKKKIILVDHNEKSQAVDNIEQAEILEIIDHHRIGDIESAAPLLFRNHPVGCTATIVYKMYQENGITVPSDMAGLLLSAILSDTLVFRSPTCTEIDKTAAHELATIAGVADIDKYAQDMFRAGSNLKDLTSAEIFFQDFKRFAQGDFEFGVGQVNFMSKEELEETRECMLPELEVQCKDLNLKMVCLMLTNILDESTDLIFYGHSAESIITTAFDAKAENSGCYLPGVVSRKKQLIPTLMNTISQLQ